jgi:hypothetical protein
MGESAQLSFASKISGADSPGSPEKISTVYKVHQVDTKDSGSHNFSFQAFKATSVASRQISSNNGGNGA